MTFLDVWIGYTVFGTAMTCAAFVWAVRSRQFSDLDRGRHIPLRAAESVDRPGTGVPEPVEGDRKPTRADRYTWIVLALLTVAAVIAALIVAQGDCRM